MMVQMASSNTLIQAMVPDRAARPRDGGLLDDVHGHGAVRRALRRLARGAHPARRRRSPPAARSAVVGAAIFRCASRRCARRRRELITQLSELGARRRPAVDERRAGGSGDPVAPRNFSGTPTKQNS